MGEQDPEEGEEEEEDPSQQQPRPQKPASPPSTQAPSCPDPSRLALFFLLSVFPQYCVPSLAPHRALLSICHEPTLYWSQETAMAGREVAAPVPILLHAKGQPVGHLGQVHDNNYR